MVVRESKRIWPKGHQAQVGGEGGGPAPSDLSAGSSYKFNNDVNLRWKRAKQNLPYYPLISFLYYNFQHLWSKREEPCLQTFQPVLAYNNPFPSTVFPWLDHGTHSQSKFGHFIDHVVTRHGRSHRRSREHRSYRLGNLNRTLLGITLLLLISACSLEPELSMPEVDIPSSWDEISNNDINCNTKDIPIEKRNWWINFHDCALNSLVEEALENNSDLIVAAGRISEARATLNLSNANRFPNITYDAQALRQQLSKTFVGSPGLTDEEAAPGTIFNNFSLSAILDYEVDLWGKMANISKANCALLLATIYAKDVITLTLQADVTIAYFNVIALNNKINIAKRLVAVYEESYKIQQSKFKHGSISQLDLEQTKADMEAIKAELPAIEQQRDEQITALAVLTGKDPIEVLDMYKNCNNTALPNAPTIDLNRPCDVLCLRPDIKQAEQQLIAANVNIGIARAAYFPTISLTALGGLNSGFLNLLFKKDSKTWYLFADVNGPLYDFGRASADVDKAKAIKEQTIGSYVGTIQTAFKEVYDSIKDEKHSEESLISNSAGFKAQEKNFALSSKQYKVGAKEYADLLNSEKLLLTYQLTNIDSQLKRLTAAVNLYKTLGGE